MKKISFIGAGSFRFTRELIRDILSFPSLANSTLVLMDINSERLDYIKKAIEKIISKGNYPAKVIATQNRAEALEGADAVICTVLCGDVHVWRSDIEIPKIYGVDINIGDTRGPAGIFRALRTFPAIHDILKDVEKYCPKTLFLNYTNPMSMICRYAQIQSKVNIIGLCHSVQKTAEMLAGWIDAPLNEITYSCAGINHQAWFLKYKWNGKDAYPLIREAVKQPEIYNHEQVRNELFIHLDYYVTESSGHNSEYNPWFRKRPDLIEKYCTHGTGWNPGHHAYLIDMYLERENTWRQEILNWLNYEDEIVLERGYEFASSVLNAVLGNGDLFKFNGNVPNCGLINNLPNHCCVEVPILASKNGLEPISIGALPPQLAALNNITVSSEELAVQGAIEGDPRKVFHAICYDPLTSAVLSLQEIKNMVGDMFLSNQPYLPQFKYSSL